MPRTTLGGSLVTHVASGTILDISTPDAHPLIAEVFHNCHQEPPTLVCDHGAPVYLQRRRNGNQYHLWAITFDGSHSHSGEPARMTDEHKRQAEYTVRAAQDAGWPSDFEVWLSKTRTRPDAVIHGTHEVGIEIQRQHITPQTAVTRTAKAMRAGLATSVWFNDRVRPLPRWFHRVPSVGMNDSPWPWDQLPPKRAVTVVSGAKNLVPLKCHPSNDYLLPVCPTRKRGHCGQWHMHHEPWMPLTVDDIAEQVPGGAMVPMRYMGRDVFLVSPESLARYEEVTGQKATLTFAPAAEMRLRYDLERGLECRVEHVWVPVRGTQLELPLATHTPVLNGTRRERGTCLYDGCPNPARLYPSGWLCDSHRPGA